MSSGQQVSITLTIDEANALKAWTSQQMAVESLNKQIRRLELKKDPLAPLQAGAKAALGTLGQMAVAFTGIGSAMAGALAVVGQIKAEYENLKSTQKGAAGSQVNYGKALEAAHLNTGNKIGFNEFDARIRRGAAKSGVSPTTFANAHGSTTGSGNFETEEEQVKAFDITTAITSQFPNVDPSTMADLAKSVGGNMLQFKFDAEKSLGLLLATSRLSPSTDVHSLAKNVMPSIAKLSAFGGTPDENMALVTYMQKDMQDDPGQLSGHASIIALGKELEKRFPNEKTPLARVRRIQNEGLSDTVLKGGTIDGKKFEPLPLGDGGSLPTLRKLFDKNSEGVKTFEGMRADTGNEQDWANLPEQTRKAANANPIMQNLKTKRKLEARAEQAQLIDVSGGLASVTREGLEQITKAAGFSDIGQKFALAKFELNTKLGKHAPAEELANQFEEEAGNLEAPIRSRWISGGSGGAGGAGGYEEKYHDPAAATEEGKKTASQLREAAAELRQGAQAALAANLSEKASDIVLSAKDILERLKGGGSLTPDDHDTLSRGNSSLRGMLANRPAEAIANTDASNEKFGNLLRLIDAQEKANKAPGLPPLPGLVQSSHSNVRTLLSDAKKDGTVSPEELTGIQGALGQASGVSEGAAKLARSGGDSGLADAILTAFQGLKDEMKTLSAKVEGNSSKLDANSKATEENSNSQSSESLPQASRPVRGPVVSDMQQRKR